MPRFVTLATLVCAFSVTANSMSLGRTWRDGIEGQLGQNVYRYYLPAGYDESVEYPLVLFLHGAGESGFDNNRQVQFHIGGLINQTESEFPAILVAPQLPRSVGWSPFQTIDRTSEILDQLVDTLSVDTNRLYLTGLSMGGFGSMEYVQRYNAEALDDFRFAAVAPLSGAFIDTGRPGVPENLVDTPIWLVHGSNDGVVNVETSRSTFRTLADLGASAPIPFDENLLGGPTAIVGNVRYTELIGQGHNIWTPIYNSTTLYDWMFAQSLAVPEPSTVLLGALSGLFLFGRRNRCLIRTLLARAQLCHVRVVPQSLAMTFAGTVGQSQQGQ